MTEDEMRELIEREEVTMYWWKCPLCNLAGDEVEVYSDALEDLKYHINEDHKGED